MGGAEGKSYQAQNRSITIALPIIALVFLVLRFVSRHIKGIRLEIDDWLLLGAMVSL